MGRQEATRAAQASGVGRLFSWPLIAVGTVAVAASPFVESRLRVESFWAIEDRQPAAEQQAHFDKLYMAYVLERNRRAGLGEPDMPEPTALVRAREKLKVAKQPLRAAQRRPAQIATALRMIGAGCCLAGLAILWLTRRSPPAAALKPEA